MQSHFKIYILEVQTLGGRVTKYTGEGTESESDSTMLITRPACVPVMPLLIGPFAGASISRKLTVIGYPVNSNFHEYPVNSIGHAAIIFNYLNHSLRLTLLRNMQQT